MSLLNLSPEATRLRRIAKACSAGELSRLEYREARRRVIDQLLTAAGDGDEDTVPRFDAEITQRRTASMSEPADGVSRQNRLVWGLLLAVLLAGLTLPAWSHAAAVIPVLGERDPNPATAPRYPVASVRWTVPEDLAAALQPEVETLLASRLRHIRQQNAPLQHGFSPAELEEVGRFLNAIGVHDQGRQVMPGDLEDLNAIIAVQKEKRGVSLIQLEQLAQELQTWLRGQGYPIAQAYVPAQTVTDGAVELGVQLGVLSSITVPGDQGSPMKYQLADLLGRRVERDVVETKLNTLNSSRGVRAEVSFAPGDAVGEAAMVLHVKPQQRFSGLARLDNHAVDELGAERLLLSGQWNNPRGVGDVLSATAFTTLDPRDHQYGQIKYAAPVIGGKLDAAVQLAAADLRLQTGAAIEGHGMLFDAQLTDTQLFTRTRRRALTFGLGVHDFDWDMVPGQRAWFTSAGVRGHRLWDRHKIALSGSVQGLFGGVDAERPGQDSTYWRVRAAMSGWTPLDLPWIGARAKLVLEVQAQASADLLPATLRLGAAGPHANRGFAQGRVLLDQGVGVNAALRFDAPLGQWWTFLDSTYGETAGLAGQWLHLSSLGVGWQAELLRHAAGKLSSRVTVGYPISHKGSGGIDDDGTQIYWSLQFAH